MNRERRRIKARFLLLLLTFLPLYGCGGGASSSTTPEVLCSGGTPSTSQTPSSDQMVVYQSTCQGSVNTPVVTLRICVPSTTTCEDVPNILVDLGSTGLRLSHTLSISSQLPQESENGGSITECYAFVSGYNYGPVVTATVTLANQTVTVPVQISYSTLSAPSSCTSTGPSAPFEPAINGILGVLFPQDDSLDGLYYEGGSGPTTISTTLMVQNPVFLITSPDENNGVLLSGFGTVSQTQGASSVSGLLTFGTGSASGLTQLETTNQAYISASYNGNSNLPAFFDSGSNGWFIDNSYINIPECTSASLSGFFCGQASIQATLTGTNNSSVSVSFSIDSAQTLLNTGNQDFSTLGGPFSGYFDAGFPAFLYGNTIGVGWNPATPNSLVGYFLYGN